MNRILPLSILLILALLVAVPAPALELGDPAPPLEGLEFVKGEAIDIAQLAGEKALVVEFWATWCPPCRDSIPHLTKLQEEYAEQGLVIVGISNEDLETVKPFVEEMGEKMDYRVAVDAGRKVGAAYMEAFNVPGIPHAFVVDKQGKLVWHGHPMAGMDAVIEKVLAGEYDPEQGKQMQQQRMELMMKLQQYFGSLQGEGTLEELRPLGEEIYELAKDSVAPLNALAWNIVDQLPADKQDLELARKAADRGVELSESLEPAVLDTQAHVYFALGQKEKAIEIVRKAMEVAPEDPDMDYSYLQDSLDQFTAAPAQTETEAE